MVNQQLDNDIYLILVHLKWENIDWTLSCNTL